MCFCYRESELQLVTDIYVLKSCISDLAGGEDIKGPVSKAQEGIVREDHIALWPEADRLLYQVWQLTLLNDPAIIAVKVHTILLHHIHLLRKHDGCYNFVVIFSFLKVSLHAAFFFYPECQSGKVVQQQCIHLWCKKSLVYIAAYS